MTTTNAREITRIGLPTTAGKLVALLTAVECPTDAVLRHYNGSLRVETPSAVDAMAAAHERTQPEGNDAGEPTP